MAKRESRFQAELIKKIKAMFAGCVVLKTNPKYIQGFPDLLILVGERWASLECKREEDAKYQQNQEYYIEKLDGMSFARTIYPENEKEVLDELQQAFKT